MKLRKKPTQTGEMAGYPYSNMGFSANFRVGVAAAADSSLSAAQAAWSLFDSRRVKPTGSNAYNNYPNFAVVPRSASSAPVDPSPVINPVLPIAPDPALNPQPPATTPPNPASVDPAPPSAPDPVPNPQPPATTTPPVRPVSPPAKPGSASLPARPVEDGLLWWAGPDRVLPLGSSILRGAFSRFGVLPRSLSYLLVYSIQPLPPNLASSP